MNEYIFLLCCTMITSKVKALFEGVLSCRSLELFVRANVTCLPVRNNPLFRTHVDFMEFCYRCQQWAVNKSQVWRAAAATAAKTQNSAWWSQSNFPLSKHSLASSDCVEMRKTKHPRRPQLGTAAKDSPVVRAPLLRLRGQTIWPTAVPLCIPDCQLGRLRSRECQRCSATCQL